MGMSHFWGAMNSHENNLIFRKMINRHTHGINCNIVNANKKHFLLQLHGQNTAENVYFTFDSLIKYEFSRTED